MTEKKTLTNENIAKLATAAKGERTYHWDDLVQGFAVRVTDSGAKSFILSAKLFGEKNTRALTIGKVGIVPLAVARQTARDWKQLIADKKDPRTVVKAAEQAKADELEADEKNCFRTVGALYLKTALRHLTEKSREDIARAFEQVFNPSLGDRHVASITTADCVAAIVLYAKGAPSQARTVLSFLKQFFNWMVTAGYVQHPVTAVINGTRLLGKRNKGKRVLTDAELKAVWRIAGLLPYPLGPLYMLLILTGCRLSEIRLGHRDEIDWKAKVWLIPGKRMKMKKPHAIPLTALMLDVLALCPRLNEGGYLFSYTNGVTPLAWKQLYKDELDASVGFADWVNHDLRRTMRTRLSPARMGIPFEIRERMVAHAMPGEVDVYDHYDHLDEKRDGFERWCAEVVRLTGGLPTRIKLVA